MSNLTIATTKTKSPRSVHLAVRTLETEESERIISLIRIDGKERECDQFLHEWQHTIERTLGHGEGDAYERLEGSLKEINGLLKAIQIYDAIEGVDAILGVWSKDHILHLAQAGRAEAYLSRDGSTMQITEKTPRRGGPSQFLFISSGDLQQGDTVILSTERLLRCMTIAQLNTSIQKQKTELLDHIRETLEAEHEVAAIAQVALMSSDEPELPLIEENLTDEKRPEKKTLSSAPTRRNRNTRRAKKTGESVSKKLGTLSEKSSSMIAGGRKSIGSFFRQFQVDLQHPTRKRRAHFLLLASALIVFIGIWSGFQLISMSRKSQSRIELEQLVETVQTDIRNAENRHLMGDLESANAILNRAEEKANSILNDESTDMRTDALNLLDQIREKRESISNIVRITPKTVANLTSRNPNISAQGIVGIERGRLIVYDRQNLYSVIVNAVDEPQRLDGENLILNGTYFPRYDTSLFMTKENRLIELIDGQPTAMKTDDPAGWLSGVDIETYIRFLYILSPQNNQILKYERLSNRYGEPSEYNVNGNLENAIDMTIDSDVYILKSGGEIVKLFRGEDRPFTIRNLPVGALDTASKIVKSSDRGNFYFLDPENKRVIVTRTDDDSGESLYLKQFSLDDEKIEQLQDLYVDPDETQLMILDEKRLYSINLQEE